MRTFPVRQFQALMLIGAACVVSSGCALHGVRHEVRCIAHMDIPRELDKISLPTYRVEPPDILLIEAVNNIRPPEDLLRAGDELIIQASGLIPPDPEGDALEAQFNAINSVFRVQPSGIVDLGPIYGPVRVSGLTLDGAREALIVHLRDVIGLKEPRVAVDMPNIVGRQVISGEHLVRPDGTIALGIYGSVYAAGLTTAEIKVAVEAHLAQFVLQPEVSVDVLAYNSKVYYVITDGGGFGERVARLPSTGSETVLDAVAQIEGLSEVSSKKMWIARPAPSGTECAQTLPVDWRAITEDGVTATNYQVFPGDRIYIKADKLVACDNFIRKLTAPAERILGFILLSNATVRAVEGNQQGTGGGGFGGGF